MHQIPAFPHPWPRYGPLELTRTALVVVDMQRDFCEPEGYFDQLGYDLTDLRRPIGEIKRLLEAARLQEMPVIFTRQGFRADLRDVASWRRAAVLAGETTVGRNGPLGRVLIRDEPGWQILPDLAPRAGEAIVDKSSNSAFHGTDLELVLKGAGVEWLVFCGITLDICVHSTLRSAVDRQYQCLVIGDACGAIDQELHRAAIRMITIEDGVLGAVADTDTFISALS